MDSTQLYQRILGLPSPWQVSEVNINEINGEVVIRVTHTGQGMTCPTCKRTGHLHDHASLRRWRHLDTCQMATVIECPIPRVRCDEHGVLQLPAPWAGPKSRFTLLFESRSIDAMLVCPRSGAADLLGISVHSLGRIACRAVVATVPGAQDKIVHDKFHLVKAANDAMEQTRRSEMAKCREKKAKDSEKLLKSSRYALLRSGTDLAEKFQDRVDTIDEWFHDTGDAYRMKESIRQILSIASPEAVSERLLEWVDWVKGPHLDPMEKVAKLVMDRMKGILNIFRLKQSNANAESLNARIQAVRVKSRGHRNYEAFKRDMLFHLGGLELHPVFPT